MLDYIKLGFMREHSVSIFRVLMLDVEASRPGRIQSLTLSLGQPQNREHLNGFSRPSILGNFAVKF
jgi:hypothetical protein